MAFSPVMGTLGRLRVGSNVTVAGISSWRRSSQVQTVPYPHFETAADGQSNVTPSLLKGLASHKFTVQGFYNVDTTDQTETGTPGLALGAVVSGDFLVQRDAGSANVGYHNVSCIVSAFDLGVEINNKVSEFTATLDVNGVLPAVSSTS
jgi:hypothetical protein